MIVDWLRAELVSRFRVCGICRLTCDDQSAGIFWQIRSKLGQFLREQLALYMLCDRVSALFGIHKRQRQEGDIANFDILL